VSLRPQSISDEVTRNRTPTLRVKNPAPGLAIHIYRSNCSIMFLSIPSLLSFGVSGCNSSCISRLIHPIHYGPCSCVCTKSKFILLILLLLTSKKCALQGPLTVFEIPNFTSLSLLCQTSSKGINSAYFGSFLPKFIQRSEPLLRIKSKVIVG
jgi:hypothetical protein